VKWISKPPKVGPSAIPAYKRPKFNEKIRDLNEDEIDIRVTLYSFYLTCYSHWRYQLGKLVWLRLRLRLQELKFYRYSSERRDNVPPRAPCTVGPTTRNQYPPGMCLGKRVTMIKLKSVRISPMTDIPMTLVRPCRSENCYSLSQFV
jgi:hypothetical protein